MSFQYYPNTGDFVRACKKLINGFTKEKFPTRVSRVHRGGGRRRAVYKVDLRFSDDGTVESATPVTLRRVPLVILDEDPGRGNTDIEEDEDNDGLTTRTSVTSSSSSQSRTTTIASTAINAQDASVITDAVPFVWTLTHRDGI